MIKLKRFVLNLNTVIAGHCEAQSSRDCNEVIFNLPVNIKEMWWENYLWINFSSFPGSAWERNELAALSPLFRLKY
jgi:hypothetical protein